MPISGNATYLPTADAFITHWTAANTVLGVGNPVITAKGTALAGLSAERGNLAGAFVNVTHAINSVETARATLAATRARTSQLISAFNSAVRGRLGGSSFVPALPAVPGSKDSAAIVAQAADDAANLWEQINEQDASPGFTPPLVLSVPPEGNPLADPVNLDMADFNTVLAKLKTDTTVLSSAEQNLIMARDDRDLSKKRLYEILKDYRSAIPGYFAVGTPMRESLPALSPAPGGTPDPVVATGSWDTEEAKGRISFTASANPNLDRYELRYCAGSEYRTEDEVSIATLPATASPLVFLTLDGLTTPGTTALYRVYVILTTGNERGSNTVPVTRPA